MKQAIYAVYDRKAQSLVGGLFMYRHPAAAIRYFTDGLQQKDTVLSMHPEDFVLYRLGHLNEDGLSIEPDQELVLSGESWLASQEASE